MGDIIPKYIMDIIKKLEETGYEAFLVGGSVRDLLLGKEPSDYDLTTNARPDEIIKVFKDHKTILTGLEFGTVTVVVEKDNVEITTYRIEEEYIDGRKPSEVRFTNKLEEDLSRRDFTINAMAYNEDLGVVDYFKGREDIEKGLIKTVGNPRERFREDHLRILRAIRFASQLDFTIDEATYNACREMGKLLKNISAERIREELFKILLSDKPSYGLGLMKDVGILEVILPELVPTIGFDQKNPHHDRDVFDHILCVVDKTPAVLGIRLGALLHDIGKPHTLTLDDEGIGHFYGHDKLGADLAGKILTRLRCPNDLIIAVKNLVREHMIYHNDLSEKGLKRLISRMGDKEIFDLLDLQKADRRCSASQDGIEVLEGRKREIERILDSQEVYEKKQLDINGSDIINLGYKEGRIIGVILDYLLEEVLENPELNKRQLLIDRVKEEENIWGNYLEQME